MPEGLFTKINSAIASATQSHSMESLVTKAVKFDEQKPIYDLLIRMPE